MRNAIIFSTLVAITCNAIAINIHVCQECLETPQYKTINAALAAANSGDTLKVHWEGEEYSTYSEHVVIQKNVTLTSDWTPSSDPDERPMVCYELTVGNEEEIIRVDVSDVTISNLRIQSSIGLTPSTGDELNMTCDAGIYMKSGNGTISNCRITRCRVGILLESTIAPYLNNVIDSCEIGVMTTDRWRAPDQSFVHDGNFFGIVQIDPVRTAAAYPVGAYQPDRITNCTIARNRFYGIVLRGGTMAHVENNRIVWNGTDATIENSNHYGDGGILCLFTSAEMAQTDVEVQSPMILSNTIYGNDGYQVCVITDDPGREPRSIANAPVLMSNIIGPDTMNYPTGTPSSAPNWLVSCTSESTNAASTPQHGSAPIMAFNNLYRPGATGPDTTYFAHPGNPTPTRTPTSGTPTSPPSPTATPSPTGTLYTPSYSWTPTPGPGTPGHGTRTPAPAYTARPTFTPTPTGTPPTPTAGPYRIDAATWSIHNTFGDPKFVGGDTIEDFDFHLKDPVFQMTPTPNDSRSVAYDSGGFRLNPGHTQSNASPDIGQVDIGAHYPSIVPAVTDLSCRYESGTWAVQWTNPDRYPDNALYSDFAGIAFYFGQSPPRSVTILSQLYLDPCSEYVFTSHPSGANRFGVATYNASGSLSAIVWQELCN